MEIKEDCFAYDKEHHDCTALTDLYCKKEKCKFYKNEHQISKKYIEACIKRYASK